MPKYLGSKPCKNKYTLCNTGFTLQSQKSWIKLSLKKFWKGHSESNQTEEYVKLFDEITYRREVADSIGLGFEIVPEKPIVRNVPKKSVRVEVGVAA